MENKDKRFVYWLVYTVISSMLKKAKKEKFDFDELENNKEFFFKSKKVTKNKKAGRKNSRNKRSVA